MFRQIRFFVILAGVVLVVVGIGLGCVWWKTKNPSYEPACFVFTSLGGLLLALASIQ